MKKLFSLLLAIIIVSTNIQLNVIKAEDITNIELESVLNSDGTYSFSALLNGSSVSEYDYVWHCDPNTVHDEVKNSPAEYFTGDKPEGDIYIAHDIYYYPMLDTSKFVKGTYDGETEWLYYYESEEYKEYLFSTLPYEGSEIPIDMMHTEIEAYNNAVLHINKAGTYRLSGNWHGQINIDLGEDSFNDPTAVVTLILDNVDIECTVASGVCFYQVYEIDNTWEDREEAITSIDTTNAGVNIIIADDSINTVKGTNIFRMFKAKYKDEDSTETVKLQKKARKVDAAFYSYMSMNIDGEDKDNGVLNINSSFEGLDTELHLTINGANINITSGNDGINVNEDDVSIVTINGGIVQILAGTGYEGDGIDSNGYININGGTVISSAKPQADSGLDSDKGTFINGGTVIATGSSMDLVTEYSEDADQVTLNLVFSSNVNITDEITIKNTKEKEVYSFDLSSNEFFKDTNRTYQCLVISSDKFSVNDEYHIYLNNKQLSYTGNTNGFGPMGGFNGNMPNMFDGEKQDIEKGEIEDINPEDIPEGFEKDGGNFDPQNMPNVNDGNFKPDDMPDGFDKSNIPNNFNPNGETSDSSSEAKTEFVVEDKVNTYSGVSTNNLNVQEYKNETNKWIYIGTGAAVGVVLATIVLILVKKKKSA